jgi:molybdopterin synthase sulfur carrier subunit
MTAPAEGRAAAVTVHVPGVLRDRCEGVAALALCATTVRGVLEQIEARWPDLHASICDETGAVRRHVNLFVNHSHVRDRENLDTTLSPGDVVTILPAVSGG